MEIKRSGSQPSGKGPADWFTGTVRIDPLFQAPDPALVQGASVTFEPAARSVGVVQSRRSVPATSYGSHPERSIGTERRQPQP